MLGNDIVDFHIDEKKYHNLRFTRRILTRQERQYLSQSKNPNQFLWSLWAAKEACYKASQRKNDQLSFSPIAFHLTTETLSRLLKTDNLKELSGEISFEQQLLSINLYWPEPTVVHCVACLNANDWTQIDSQICHIPKLSNYQKQSQAVRDLAQKLLKKHHIQASIIRPRLNMSDYHKPGPPILIDRKTQQPLSDVISLSHDHNYLAVALYRDSSVLK